MIDAYVINLEKDKERINKLKQNITNLNVSNHINFVYIKAVEQSTFNDHVFTVCNTWFDPYLKTGITTGEVGCALSHNKCWNQFYTSQKEYALILEDDVEFTEKYDINLETLLNYPKDADIVYIHRKKLKQNEIKYDDVFTNVKASSWTCGYLLTRKGVEKLLKTKYLDNLIVVDDFLPILYDAEYLPRYKQYYNDVRLNAYAIENGSIVTLIPETFSCSNTFHSKYYKYDNNFIVVTSDVKTSMSSINRFIYSCEKFSLNVKIINDVSAIVKWLDTIVDEDKIIIICDSNYSFFINNPLHIFLRNSNHVYKNFNNLNDFITGYNNNTIYFYGKKNILTDILTDILKNNSILSEQEEQTEIVKCLSMTDHNNNNICDDNNNNNNYIIVNGYYNKLLLNKYENYILRKIYKSYGYHENSAFNNYNFKIRVNVMIYDRNYKHCINNLKKIDYPMDLIDIHIYTNQELLNDNIYNIQIHNLNIFQAYKEMYNYYADYDYIWIISSSYIITDFSLLKKCIDANKNVTSGLQKSKKTLLSNFWGDISNSGWYKRSNDYIDIVNQNKINLWNVPYICGNVLINTNILKKYDILKVINYDTTNVDMVLCENLRLNNEGLYLLNNKCYGYICDQLDDFGLSEWSEESILHEDFYDFLYNNKTDIFNEIGTDIWNMPFFSVEFCDYLIKISEERGEWSNGVFAEKTEIDKRINAVENIPTQDVHLKDLKMEKFWSYVVNNYFKKIMSCLYKYKTKDYNIAFIVKYDYENGQKSLMPHHDASVYTINVALNSSDNYTGGGVNFIHKKCMFLNKNPGYLLLHPGRITHYHEALPITSGKRYILVSFNN